MAEVILSSNAGLYSTGRRLNTPPLDVAVLRGEQDFPGVCHGAWDHARG